MMRGIAISTLVHASVLAMAMVSWPQQQNDCERQIAKLRREEPGISSVAIVLRLPQCASSADLPIDFVEIGSVSDISELRKAPDPVEAPPQPAPEPEPETETALEPETSSAPDVEEVNVPDPRAPVPPKAADAKKPKEETPKKLIEKTPPKKKEDDLAFLDDFDKTLQSKQRETQRAAADRPALANADRDREGAGEGQGNTASLQAALRRQIGYCWRGIEDLPREDQIDVILRVELNRDGTLAAPVDLISPASRPVGRSGLAVDLALRAVRKCAPYKLPEDDYEQWKLIDVTVGPRAE